MFSSLFHKTLLPLGQVWVPRWGWKPQPEDWLAAVAAPPNTGGSSMFLLVPEYLKQSNLPAVPFLVFVCYLCAPSHSLMFVFLCVQNATPPALEGPSIGGHSIHIYLSKKTHEKCCWEYDIISVAWPIWPFCWPTGLLFVFIYVELCWMQQVFGCRTKLLHETTWRSEHHKQSNLDKNTLVWFNKTMSYEKQPSISILRFTYRKAH